MARSKGSWPSLSDEFAYTYSDSIGFEFLYGQYHSLSFSIAANGCDESDVRAGCCRTPRWSPTHSSTESHMLGWVCVGWRLLVSLAWFASSLTGRSGFHFFRDSLRSRFFMDGRLMSLVVCINALLSLPWFAIVVDRQRQFFTLAHLLYKFARFALAPLVCRRGGWTESMLCTVLFAGWTDSINALPSLPWLMSVVNEPQS